MLRLVALCSLPVQQSPACLLLPVCNSLRPSAVSKVRVLLLLLLLLCERMLLLCEHMLLLCDNTLLSM